MLKAFSLFFILSILLSSSLLSQNEGIWNKIKASGQQKIIITYNEFEPYLYYNEEGKLVGIEQEIIAEFLQYVQDVYKTKLDTQWVRQEFDDVYNSIQSNSLGDLGGGNISITTERQKDVDFSPPYMPDIEVIISGLGLPIVSDTTEFIQFFEKAQAVTIPNNTFEIGLKRLKETYLPDLQIIYVKNYDEMIAQILQNPYSFAYVSLPTYVKLLKQGVPIQKQSLFEIKRTGAAFIFPKQSNWKLLFDDFFASPEFETLRQRSIQKYFGSEVAALIADTLSVNGIDSLTQANRDAQVKLLLQEGQIRELELYRKTFGRNLFIGGFVIILIITIAIYGRSRTRKRNNKMLSQQNEIIRQQREDILDSIDYANQIQHIALNSEEDIAQQFEDYFVYARPRDIVSGDFFWLASFSTYKIITLVDCVGHGVPGAFMTLLTSTFFNDIITQKKYDHPVDILNELDKRVSQTLAQRNEQSVSLIGMDLALIRIDFLKKTFTFSAAKSSVIWLNNGDLKELLGVRRPIGDATNYDVYSFNEKTFSYNEGDILYLFSDGYIDQFGGEDNRKFTKKRLKDLIFKIKDKTLTEQKKTISESMKAWMGDFDQTDDMLVIAVRL